MKKMIVFLLACSLYSCSKDQGTSVTTSNWTVANITYGSKTIVLGTNDVRWYDVTNPGNASVIDFITIEFSTSLPTVAGTYDIGGTGTASTYIKSISAVVNSTSTNNKVMYLFDENTKTGTATITINNGKRNLTFGSVPANRMNGSNQLTGYGSISGHTLEF